MGINEKAYQNDDLQDVQMTRLATWRTALMMSLQLVPGQNLKNIQKTLKFLFSPKIWNIVIIFHKVKIRRALEKDFATQYAERILNKTAKAINETFAGLMLQGFRIYFVQNPSIKGIESTS